MRFKNFDIADVIGCNDVEQAKAYTGKKGYYADHLEQLDDFIENNRHIGTLHSITSKDTFERLIVGCEFDYPCPYTYFLPLDKVKKTESKEKESKWRPCTNVFEVCRVLGIKVRDEDGVRDCIQSFFNCTFRLRRAKTCRNIGMFVKITAFDYKTTKIYLPFGAYTFEKLFNTFEICVNGNWQPFGIEVENE